MIRRGQEMGASLITVLMIVAAMSAVAVGITQLLTKGVFRAKALDAQAQLRVSVLAAEAFGQFELSNLLLENEGRLTPDMPGFFAPISRSLDQGTISLRFSDQTNCFDLNRLGIGDSASDIASARPEIDRLVSILVAAGIERYAAEIFAESSADWIDSDTLTQLNGAENNFYESERSPVRARGSWLINETEMFGIRGFNAEIRNVAPDLLCARPKRAAEARPELFNINTITSAKLPLLVAAYEGEVDRSTLEDGLRRRPTNGWAKIEDFIADAALTELDPEFIAKGAISLYPRYIQGHIRLQYQEMAAEYEVLYEIGGDGPVNILQRRRSG